MNELTGAFSIAKEKGEDILVTRQSLANAGYSIQEIEEAIMESKQLLEPKFTDIQKEVVVKKAPTKLILLISFALIILGIALATFFFKDSILSFINGLGSG